MKFALRNILCFSIIVCAASKPGYAQNPEPTEAAAVAESRRDDTPPRPRWSLGLGVGSGGISATDDEGFSQGISSTLQLGYRLSSKLQLQLDGEYTSFARFESDPTRGRQQSAVTVGVRWSPFETTHRLSSPHIDLSNVYLKGGLGVGHEIGVPYDTINPFRVDHGKWGGAVTGGIGWMPIRGPGYSFGIEASDSLVLSSDDVSHNFGLNLLVNVDLF